MRIPLFILLFCLPAFSQALERNELAVIINEADPVSVKVARYYQQRRGIPDKNMIRIRFKPGAVSMSPQQFRRIKQQVDANTPAHIQAYALTWPMPYRVGCMSITSAFTFGFDKRYCARGCKPTRPSRYFNTPITRPWTRLGMRPTMMIAAKTVPQTYKLIERGIAADNSRPRGSAYLVSTRDRSRNVRSRFYPRVQQVLGKYINVKIIRSNTLKNRSDVMFYFTGLKHVPDINSNRFLPGAVADHLTSAGGNLLGISQMSILEWIAAGATGSYGTVVEPCNFLQKFPHPGVVIVHYLNGDTLIEAYWKSVLMPGQGLFVGEPLSRPWGRYTGLWH